MRFAYHAPALALAVAGASMIACGSKGPGGGGADGAAPADASADGALEDGAFDDGASDGPSDVEVLDGSGDGSPSPGDAGPDASVGTVVVAVDASLRTTVVGGNQCAAITSFVAAPNWAAVGHTIQLSASGLDANGQSSDVTITWAASGGFGSLMTTTGTANTFSCTSAGSETVDVTASISAGGASCPGTGTLVAMLTCVTP